MTTKARRQHLIGELLAGHEVTSQHQIVALLAEHGIEVTQATVCRDFDEMGVAKMRFAGHTVYAVPEGDSADSALPWGTLRRVFSEWVLSARHSHNLVLMKTPPGSAHVVASAVDRSQIVGVLGTVAGDDTVIVVADERTGGSALAEEVRSLAGL